MKKPDEVKRESRMSRRRFGAGMALGLGGAAIFRRLRGFFRARPDGPLHEAEFYEQIRHDEEIGEDGVER